MIGAEQIVRSPAECRRYWGPSIEEPACILDELQPAPQRHVPRRLVGIEPGVARRPLGRNAVSLTNPEGRSYVVSGAFQNRISFPFACARST